MDLSAALPAEKVSVGSPATLTSRTGVATMEPKSDSQRPVPGHRACWSGYVSEWDRTGLLHSLDRAAADDSQRDARRASSEKEEADWRVPR